MPTFTRITPRMPIMDFQRSVAFYLNALGFCVNLLWPEDKPTFAILDRDGARVGLFVPTAEYPDKIGYAELYIESTDVQGPHAALRDHLQIEEGARGLLLWAAGICFSRPGRLSHHLHRGNIRSTDLE